MLVPKGEWGELYPVSVPQRESNLVQMNLSHLVPHVELGMRQGHGVN